jgi:hypothetical protein
MDVNTKVETARLGAAGVAVTIYGLTLNEWVAIATLVYLAVQILILAPKAFITVSEWGACLRGRWKKWRS